MGHTVPPDEPDLGTCSDCCANLPEILHCRLTVPTLSPLTGDLDQAPGTPCEFQGLVTDGNGRQGDVYLIFCWGGSNDTHIFVDRVDGFWCALLIIADNHCRPWIDGICTQGCRFEVWP